MTVELRNALGAAVGAPLSPTLLFEYPTVNALTRHLATRIPLMRDAVVPQEALSVVQESSEEPIAVIGMSCRFPGAPGLEEFWGLLQRGEDATREVPDDRWDVDEFYDPDPEVAGKMYTRRGGFIDGIDLFDPHFFGISPREASSMDPQQRLLLEGTWQALERAGIAPDGLAGTRTGVFVGISGSEWAFMGFKGMDAVRINPYSASGASASIASGRLSYVLGLQGPCVSVDTACSSSMVAAHLACQSLRSGESNLAVVGGVGILLLPEGLINLSRARMVSPDGRCKTFDARADGYARGEGCGIVILKRLSDAERDGNPVLAVIRGSAVNQDGRSGGLTAPNGLAQEAVLRDALTSAHLKPADVSYVEAHGTGTPLGDPIEVRALMAVMGEGRSRERALVLGSAKTNIGHLEAAARNAGLIKVVLSLQHGEIPAHLHFENPSPHIAWDELPVTVPTALRSWPEGRKIAGVSSFGFSGTNAHMILEEAPQSAVRESSAVDRPLHMLSLSGMNEEALLELAGRYRAYLGGPEVAPLGDVCFTANVGRAHFAHRLAVVGGTAVEVAAKLQSFETGQESPGVFRGVLSGRGRPKVAFLFTGQGSQYAGMGRGLYETQPTFRKALDLCAEILKGRLEKPLLEVMFGAAGSEGLVDRTAYTQPSLFALEWALSEMWRSWGVEPGAVLGHSVGEYVAAAVSGVLTLEDALGLIAERGRLMEALPSGGVMVAVAASEERVGAAIATVKEVSIAAVNGPSSVVISGTAAAVKQVSEALRKDGIKSQELVVSHAFHSALLDPMLGALETAASKVENKAPQMAMLSNLTGRVMKDGEVSAGYWRHHAREAVRFADSMRTLEEKGYEVFVELGPHPVLLGMGRGCVKDGLGSWMPSLRKGKDDWSQLLESVAGLYVGGVPFDGAGFDRDYSRRRVVLPTYPFQRQRYWIEVDAAPREVTRAAVPTGFREWLCALEWQPAPQAAASTTVEPGRWLVCGAESGVGPALVAALRGRGHLAVLATTGGAFASSPAGFIVDPTRPDQVDRLLAGAAREGPLAGVVNLWGLDAPAGIDPLETQRHVSGSALHLAQSLARQADPGRLWLVTRGAQAVGGGTLRNVDQAPLWGLGRTLFVEQPALGCICVDLDPESDGLDRLVEELLAGSGSENQIALRGGERYAARLVKSSAIDSSEPPQLRPDATYLVTGGLRGLGSEVAKWLVERGARNLALVGRRAPAAPEAIAIQALEVQGVRVLTVAVDVADRVALKAAFARVDATLPPLRGVVHCAGVIDDGLLADQTWDRFAGVMAPKLGGAANLDALTRERELDFFVLFSSSASLLGSPGQANYAAANAWMDALAHRRRSEGLAATAINWGAWGEVGMAARLDEATRRRKGEWGAGVIPLQDGLAALGLLIGGGAAQIALLPIDWPALLAHLPEPRPAFLTEVAVAVKAKKALSTTEGPPPGLDRAAPEERRAILEGFVAQQVVKVLALESTTVLGRDEDFRAYGMDSLMAMDLRNRLQTSLGRPLSPSVAMEHSTISALASLLAQESAVPEAGTAHQLLAAVRSKGVDAAVDDLSTADVDRLLEEMMRKRPE
jgi:acyl transferase domain-containing protein